MAAPQRDANHTPLPLIFFYLVLSVYHTIHLVVTIRQYSGTPPHVHLVITATFFCSDFFGPFGDRINGVPLYTNPSSVRIIFVVILYTL